MPLSFKEFMQSGAFLPSDWTGSDSPHPTLPYVSDLDLGMPTVTKTSQIRHIEFRKNPIFVYLDDGTKLYIPYDAYKRIKGEPEVGKTMAITFQRRADDKSDIPSKIQSIRIL